MGETSKDIVTNFEWTVENEIKLFTAMLGLKPCGISRHFDMAVIYKKFTESLGETVPVKVIWDYLRTLYDLDALDQMEAINFEQSFQPFDDFMSQYIEKECGNILAEREALLTPKPIKDYSRKDKKAVGKKSEQESKKESPVSKDSKKEDERSKKKEEEEKMRKKEEEKKKEDNKRKRKREDEEKEESDGGEEGKKVRKTPARRSTRGKNSSDGLERDASPAASEISFNKRVLRSRGDDDVSNKSSSPAPTPPPIKRTRRI